MGAGFDFRVKVKDNKVLITDYHHSFLWVDIDEISLPYERQNDSELKEHYELLDDEFCPVPYGSNIGADSGNGEVNEARADAAQILNAQHVLIKM